MDKKKKILKIRINSRKNNIEEISREEYKINLKYPSENNKSNLELIKLLTKDFKKKM